MRIRWDWSPDPVAVVHFFRRLLHLLIGLLAAALVAGVASWIWPDGARWIWIVAYVVMVFIVLREVPNLLRKKPGE